MNKFGLSIIYIAFLGVSSHFIGIALPRSWFDPERFPYSAYAFERNGKIYKRIKVNKWKCRVPDMSLITKRMPTKRIKGIATSEQLNQLISETCVAEFVHTSLIILSLAILRYWNSASGIAFVIFYNLIGNVPYIIIQRHNRPQLMRVAGKLKKREARLLNEGTDTVM